MIAVVLKEKENLAVEEVPRFVPNPDQVIVQVKACGICGSDLRYYYGENPWALHTLGTNASTESNMILGHEFAGEVVETGNPGDTSLIGKRVAVVPYNTCGICELCLSGRYNLCRETKHIGHGAGWGAMHYYPGGMAEYCPVWRTHVYPLPDAVSNEAATLIDPLSVAIHAIKLSGIKPMDDVLVLGSGPVGLCIAQAVRGFGAGNVYCTDIIDSALTIAKAVGVDDALNSNKEDACARIMKVTKGRGAEIIFDTVGSTHTQKDALKMLAVSGTLVNLVANESQVNYRLLDLSGERRILCSANSKYEDYLLGIRFLENGTVNAKPLITHVFPIHEAKHAFNVLLDRENSGAMKVVIVPSK